MRQTEHLISPSTFVLLCHLYVCTVIFVTRCSITQISLRTSVPWVRLMWPSTRWSGEISWTEDFDHIYQNKIYFHLLPSKSNFKFCKGDFLSCDGRPMWDFIITLLLCIFNMSNLFPENTSPNRIILDNHVLLLRNHMCNEIFTL